MTCSPDSVDPGWSCRWGCRGCTRKPANAGSTAAPTPDNGATTLMFEGIPTQIEKDGVLVYGRGVGGVLLDSKRDAAIHFNMARPGRHEFRCSIHPDMKGELLLLSVEAV